MSQGPAAAEIQVWIGTPPASLSPGDAVVTSPPYPGLIDYHGWSRNTFGPRRAGS